MKKWTSQEIEYLIGNYDSMTGIKIGEQLGRTEKAIHKKAVKLGLKKSNENKEKQVKRKSIEIINKNRWTEDEVIILKDNYLNLIFDDLCAMLPNRNPDSIRQKANRLNLKKDTRITISPYKLKYIIDNFYEDSFEDIANHVGLTAEQIYYIGRYKGLKVKEDMQYTLYSDYEINVIKDNWNNRDIEKIKMLLPNRDYRSIVSKASNLGLYCDKTLSHSAKDGTILNSFEERYVYEFIKYDLNIDIKATGLSRKYKFYNEKFDENYCPDFIIEGLLDKPIIIEYYGLINSKSEIYSYYASKTERKNNFYAKQQDIYFIDLYPKDLQNNKKGVNQKLSLYINNNKIN